jgi:hypothetical protein
VPAPQLVAEQPEVGGPSDADRSLGDDSTLDAVGVGDGSHLDEEPAGADFDHEGRVVARRSPDVS